MSKEKKMFKEKLVKLRKKGQLKAKIKKIVQKKDNSKPNLAKKPWKWPNRAVGNITRSENCHFND